MQLHTLSLTCPLTNADVGLSRKEKVGLEKVNTEQFQGGAAPPLASPGHHVQWGHQRSCLEALSGFSPLRTLGPTQPDVTKTGGGEGSVLEKEGIACLLGGGPP